MHSNAQSRGTSRMKVHGMVPLRDREWWGLSVVILVELKSQQGGSEAGLYVGDDLLSVGFESLLRCRYALKACRDLGGGVNKCEM